MRYMPFHIVKRLELAATALTVAGALGLVFAVLLTGAPRSSEAASTLAARTVTAAAPTVVRTVTTHEVVTETVVNQTRQTGHAETQPSEIRYLVKPGDTLWDIAASKYHDVGEGMQAIRRRNNLKRQKILAGEVLVIPIRRGEAVGSARCPDPACD